MKTIVATGNIPVFSGGEKPADEIYPFASEWDNKQIEEDDPGIDYAEEYQKQTGRDFESGQYIIQ